jgi:hypothetical protein
MTKAQRARHLEAIRAAIVEAGLTQDRYGAYKTPSGRRRIKIGPVSIRFETNMGYGWVRSWSATWSQTDPSEIGLRAKSMVAVDA